MFKLSTVFSTKVGNGPLKAKTSLNVFNQMESSVLKIELLFTLIG